MAISSSKLKRPTKKSIQIAISENNLDDVIRHLTPRQRRFCEEYAIDFNGSKAAVRAGYSTNNSDKTAHLLMMNDGVRFYIDDLTRTKENKIVSVDPEYIVKRILDVVNAENAKHSDVLRGLELLARHKGMFVDKTEITGKDGGAIAIEQQKIAEEAHSFTNLIKTIKRKDVVEIV